MKTVYTCPVRVCGTSIIVEALENVTVQGVLLITENLLRDHLDTWHPGWTTEMLLAERSAGQVRDVFGIGPAEMFSAAPTDDRLEVERLIAAGIKSAIATHGPVTVELAMSAAKRAYGELEAAGRINHDVPVST